MFPSTIKGPSGVRATSHPIVRIGKNLSDVSFTNLHIWGHNGSRNPSKGIPVLGWIGRIFAGKSARRQENGLRVISATSLWQQRQNSFTSGFCNDFVNWLRLRGSLRLRLMKRVAQPLNETRSGQADIISENNKLQNLWFYPMICRLPVLSRVEGFLSMKGSIHET